MTIRARPVQGGNNGSFDAVIAGAGSFESIVESNDTLSTDTTINEVVRR